jgi:ABC-type uncharacterized transport system YnjBCD substrate-binding protein
MNWIRLIETVGIGGTFLVIFSYGLYLLERHRIDLTSKNDDLRFARLSSTLEKVFDNHWAIYRELLGEVRKLGEAQFELAKKLTELHAGFLELGRAVAELTQLTKEELAQIALIREREHDKT